MWVRATERGFYGRTRELGDKFQFTPRRKPKDHKGKWKGDQPGSWMEPCDPPEDLPVKPVEDLYVAVQRDGERWFDVVGPNNVPVNEKGLEEEDANTMAARLNGVEPEPAE